MPVLELACVNVAWDLFGFLVVAIIFFSCIGEHFRQRIGIRSFIILLGFVMLAILADAVGMEGEHICYICYDFLTDCFDGEGDGECDLSEYFPHQVR